MRIQAFTLSILVVLTSSFSLAESIGPNKTFIGVVSLSSKQVVQVPGDDRHMMRTEEIYPNWTYDYVGKNVSGQASIKKEAGSTFALIKVSGVKEQIIKKTDSEGKVSYPKVRAGLASDRPYDSLIYFSSPDLAPVFISLLQSNLTLELRWTDAEFFVTQDGFHNNTSKIQSSDVQIKFKGETDFTPLDYVLQRMYVPKKN